MQSPNPQTMERLIVGLAAIVVAIAAAACGAGSSTVTQTVRSRAP